MGNTIYLENNLGEQESINKFNLETSELGLNETIEDLESYEDWINTTSVEDMIKEYAKLNVSNVND